MSTKHSQPGPGNLFWHPGLTLSQLPLRSIMKAYSPPGSFMNNHTTEMSQVDLDDFNIEDIRTHKYCKIQSTGVVKLKMLPISVHFLF